MGLERTPLALSAADDVVIVPDDVVIATEEIIYESVALSLDESEVKQELVEEKAEEVKQEAENIQQASAAAESTSEKVTTEFFSSPDYSPSPAIMALAMSPLNSPIGMFILLYACSPSYSHSHSSFHTLSRFILTCIRGTQEERPCKSYCSFPSKEELLSAH